MANLVFEGRVQYKCMEDASMVRNTLAVDPELHPDLVTKSITVEEPSTLVFVFNATDARAMRGALGTFCDLLVLASNTLERFKLPKQAVANGS